MYAYIYICVSHLLRMPRWFSNQIYCNGYVTVLPGFRHNSRDGITVSIQKHGGWKSSFPMASKMAGWDLTESNGSVAGEM